MYHQQLYIYTADHEMCRYLFTAIKIVSTVQERI